MDAWLSTKIERGKRRLRSVAISLAAKVRPTSSASNTVCSSAVPRCISKMSGDYIALYSQGSPSSPVASCPLYSNPAGYIALLELP